MRLVIVPESLRSAINAKLDLVLAAHPEAACDREALYSQLLSIFDEHGYIPDFQIGPPQVVADNQEAAHG